MRSLAREAVFKFIFSKLFNQQDEGLFDVLTKELSSDDKKFANEILTSINDNYDMFLNKLSDLAINFKFDRIINADKCAILIGMAEYTIFPNTPVAIIIDEAVNLSVKYSTESSSKFVNGILAEFVKRN